MALSISIPKVVVAAGLLKYDDCAVRQLPAAGRRRGYMTFDELNDMLPASEISAEEIEAVFEAICGLGIEVTESRPLLVL
jgi:RNA polymerase primary sigma factor